MSHVAKIFLLVAAPILAALLAWLGIETLSTNPTGWFLVLVGVAYTVGLIIVYAIRKERFWESPLDGRSTHEERGDRSLWFITIGMIAAFYLSPLEYIYLPPQLPRSIWMAFGGMGIVALGIALFIWSRRALGKNYSGHVSVKIGQTLVQSGPYRLIRHPAYAGYLMMAFGLSLGYSSLAGLISVIALLLPGVIYRIKVEETLLNDHFNESYRQYMQRTKRLFPGVW